MNNFEFENPFSDPTKESPFDALAISHESVNKFLGDKDRYDSSKHVCICGHAINKHKNYEEGRGYCLTGRHICPCEAKSPVLYANDTRFFMRKTYGAGSKHALATGLLKISQLGISFKWLKPPQCMHPNCNAGPSKVYPVPLNRHSQVVNEPGAINVFLCESCYLVMKGVPGNEGKGWIW